MKALAKLQIAALILLLALGLPLALAAGSGQLDVSPAPSGQSDQPETSAPSDPTPPARVVLELAVGSHEKYMNGQGDGLFHPEAYITRAEVAQMFYNRLAQRPEGRAAFADVKSTSWYAEAVGALGELGVIQPDSIGCARPKDYISRGELAMMMSCFLPDTEKPPLEFPDVNQFQTAYEAIRLTTAHGIFNGRSDGKFHPGGAVTRAEAATAFNRLLGRSPDMEAVAGEANTRFFPDVPTTYWAYGAIMEATVSHTGTVTEAGETWSDVTAEKTGWADGLHRWNGYVYGVKDGVFLRSDTLGSFTFDAQGRYTTGDAELDATLRELVSAHTDPEAELEENMRLLFAYVRDNFQYRKRDLLASGATGWENRYAKEFLETGKGNCYSFAAAYCLLVRQLGQECRAVVGHLGKQDHGWVEAELEGVNYVFDPELAWNFTYSKKTHPEWGGDYYFKILPTTPKGSLRYIYD